MQDNKQRTIDGVPVLQDIPLLGELFKSRSTKTERTELMVFMTPHILHDEQGVTDVTQAQRGTLSDPGSVPAGNR